MSKPIEKALEMIPNRFLLTTVVAKRWESLVAGAPPLVETSHAKTMIDVALREVIEERVTVDVPTRQINLVGLPEVEQNEEPVFNEAFAPSTENVRDFGGAAAAARKPAK